MYGVELAGLLEDPTFSMGMISGFTRGAMDLTYLVQNFVQAGQFISGAFRGRILTWRELLNPAFTAVLFVLSPLFRRLLLLLRRDFPFPSLTSDVLGSLVLHLASQLS